MVAASSSRAGAQAALTAALKATLDPATVVRFLGATHTRRFADNLLPGLSQSQIAALRAQLALGAGGELWPTKTGKRPAHAPYSSAALALNAFGRWLGAEQKLQVGSLGGFAEPLEIESRQQINFGGGTANLDVLLRAPGLVVGVESKLTETLSAHEPVRWRPAYASRQMAELLDGSWSGVFAASRAGSWQPKHLGIEQLIKHTLALASRFADCERHLVYVWWEPLNAEEIPELAAHRRELAELRDRLGEASPRLHALTYTELFAEWEQLNVPWIPDHLAQLHARYAVSI
jgi:hypothetical protein